MLILSIISLVIFSIPVIYLYWLAINSIKVPPSPKAIEPHHRLAIAIPAHNEEPVIKETIWAIKQSDYPKDLYDIFVVADHCTDNTAAIAQQSGARCFERDVEPAKSKGAALNWLLEQIWSTGTHYEGFIFLDADSKPDKEFLRMMDAHLHAGERLIQGHTVISNPLDGWFPTLYFAIEIVEGRLQQQGRSNLDLSAKLTGYGFCVRNVDLESNPFPTGLTEDYEYRLNLLCKGINIRYEPRAIVFSEAPTNWQIAKLQHARWRTGIYKSRSQYRSQLLRQLLYKYNPAVMDALLDLTLPSYSTLMVLGFSALFLQLFINLIATPLVPIYPLILWVIVIAGLAIYPLIAMVLERAPLRGYLVVFIGPAFVVWRTWQALLARFGKKPVIWVRTARRNG